MIKIRWKAVFLTIAICISSASSGYIFTAEAKEFSFVYISDVHIPSYGFPIGQPLDETSLMKMHNQQRLQKFAEECLTMEPKPDFIINSGDTGDAGWITFLELYQKMMKPLVSAGIPVYTVVGNHDLDYAGIGRQDLAEIFDPLGPELIGRHGSRYSFDYGGCHLVFMNNRPISGLIRFNPMDIEWLESDLKSVKKDTRVLLFLHANMQIDDTHRIVELLQPFRYPAVFQGHKHSASIDKWGGIPVVLTGSLYGGTPEAGSYWMVTVRPENIVVRTRDFAKPPGTLEPEEIVEFPKPGPQLNVTEPENNAFVSGNVTLAVKTEPVVPGAVEYSIPGFSEWTPVPGGNGRWEAAVPIPTAPGRHLLALQFKGENGAVVLAHKVFKVPGEKVREVWSRDLGSAVQGVPVIWQDTVIIPSIEKGVYALRLDNGNEIWRREAEQGQILGRMARDGAIVYYGAGRTVNACDAKTGKLLWQMPLGGTIVAGITAGNGRLYIPAGEHKLYCLDARRGKILWDYTVDLPIIMEPAAEGSRVFFGAMDGYFRALDTDTGKEVWKNQWSSMEDNYTTAPFWPPVIAGDRVIAAKHSAGKEENNLVAFNASNGQVSWSGRLSNGTMRLELSPEKDKLYTRYNQNLQRGIQCLSANDGSLLWNKDTGVAMNAGFAFRDVVLARDAYNIYCVDAVTGEVKWTYRTSTGQQGSYYGPGATAVRDNLVIAGTMDGYVIALKW